MKKGEIESCKGCNRLHTFSLLEVSLVACPHCGYIIYGNLPGNQKLMESRVPEDWSFVKLGTTGEYLNTSFKIIGRIRLQLRNDYKNFWSALIDNGKSWWIAESHASFSIFTEPWQPYTKDAIKLRANLTIPVDPTLNVKGEYVEKCEAISYEGELGHWRLFEKGFFIVQGSHSNGQTTLFTIENKNNIDFLKGEKVTPEILKLQNIHEWSEWK